MGNDVVILNLNREDLSRIVHSAVREALAEYNLSTPPMEQPEDLLSAEEAAGFLDIKLSTLYFKTHMKEIPFMKKGKKIYFSRKELTKWIAEGRQYTRSETARISEAKLAQLKRR
jgi:excisionase family DNA binding protein